MHKSMVMRFKKRNVYMDRGLIIFFMWPQQHEIPKLLKHLNGSSKLLTPEHNNKHVRRNKPLS